jgi:NAD(P)-dependent dehydrogenase (short-subunit alcohol dehydrogenase family)
MRLRDTVAIVTGGGTGIGEAISVALAAEGATVVLGARTLSKLEGTAQKIISKGGRAKAMQVDVADERQVESVVAQTLNEYGRIDTLVNNSGVTGPTANVIDMNLHEWNEVLAINLTGAMLCAREVLKSMIPRRSGSIINIGSQAGSTGYPMRSAYCVSKWGIVGLTETLAIEVGEHNIRVNCISPAGVRGERNVKLMKAKAKALGISHEEQVQKATSKYSLKRITEPSEVAAAVVFLASDEASAITGHTLFVNCGVHLYS